MSEPGLILEREMGEQPEALARTIDGCAAEVEGLGKDLRGREITYVMIAARGSSDNAGVYAQYLFQAFNGLPVAMATPSLFTFNHRPPRLAKVLVLGISQSGQSEDIVEVLAEARRQGALTAAITADPGSPLSSQAHHTLLLQTGAEKAVAATKTYTSSLAIIASISAVLGQDKERQAAIQNLPDLASRTLRCARGPAAAKAERYRYMSRCVVISRGFCYGDAMEVALKLKELTYITAEPYSSADFMHGPMAMLEPGFPVVLIAPTGTLLPHMIEFSGALQEKKSEIIAISDAPEILAKGVTALPLCEGAPEWLSPIIAVIPGQLLALHLAKAKGVDPDAPRGLLKVTVTR
ncbi:MAG: SIS domain-containing protein [Spirochaetia bacterium]|jgi:glucosamine--fructose-6-phosphate aminotransferase (isomerizing)